MLVGMGARTVIDQVIFAELLRDHAVIRRAGGRPHDLNGALRVGECTGVLQACKGNPVNMEFRQFRRVVGDGELDAGERVVHDDRSATFRIKVALVCLVIHLHGTEDDVLLRRRGGGRGIADRGDAIFIGKTRDAVAGHVRGHPEIELDGSGLVRPDILSVFVLVNPAQTKIGNCDGRT